MDRNPCDNVPVRISQDEFEVDGVIDHHGIPCGADPRGVHPGPLVGTGRVVARGTQGGYQGGDQLDSSHDDSEPARYQQAGREVLDQRPLMSDVTAQLVLGVARCR